MAEEAAFAGEDLFSAETVEEVSVQEAAAAPAEEDTYAPQEAEAAEDAADLFAEAPADAAADAAGDSFAEEAAAAPEEDLLISEDEQTDDQGGEDLVIEGEEQTEASEEAEEGLTAEEILADDEALFAELFGEEETEELPQMEEFFTSEEEGVEAGDPVVVTLPPAGSANSGRVLMSHAGAGDSSNWEGSYGAQLDGLASYIYDELVDYAVKKNPLAIKYCKPDYKDYDRYIFDAISKSGDIIKTVSKSYKDYNKLKFIAVKQNPSLLADFYDDNDYIKLAKIAIESDVWKAIRALDETSANYIDLYKCAIDKNPYIALQAFKADNAFFKPLSYYFIKKLDYSINIILEIYLNYKKNVTDDFIKYLVNVE